MNYRIIRILACIPLYASTLSATKTFNFPFILSTYTFDRTTQSLIVGAGVPTTGDAATQAISRIFQTTSDIKTIEHLTPQKVTLNGTADSDNPLHGAQINLLDLMITQPIAVKNGDATHIYAINKSPQSNASTIVLSASVNDAHGNPGNILAIKGRVDVSAVAVAVAPQSGTFGDTGSGIALGQIRDNVFEFANLQILNSTNGNRAAPLTRDTSSVALGGTASFIESPVILLDSKVYVGLHAQAANQPNAGICAVALGENSGQETLSFSSTSIVPPAAIGTDSIIGAQGALAEVTIHGLSIMKTSTDLYYLIVQGGVGTASATQQSVFALPLMNSGVLAKKNSNATAHFASNYPYKFINRTFDTAAQQMGDLYTSTDTAAIVGGASAPEAITGFWIERDAVFISTGTNNSHDSAGIFSSQALFDNQGRIKGWTNWQRAGGVNATLFGLAINARDESFWCLPAASASTITTVQHSEWSATSVGATPFDTFINTAFIDTTTPEETGGVQGLNDIIYTMTGLDQTIGNRISVTIATGYNKVVLAQSGQDTGTLFTPNTSFDAVFNSNDGTFTGFSPSVTGITMTGGDLNNLKAIITAALVTDSSYGWFVVGGNGGLAVLTHADGTGWPLTPGLGKNFSGLDSTLTWKKIGNYTNVLKVYSDNAGNIYILTPNQLDRITVHATQFAQNSTLTVTTLFTLQKNILLSDIIIAGPLGLLATNKGLLRSGNNIDIRTTQRANWEPITLPESPGPATRLCAISTTGQPFDLLTGCGGNLYVLSSFVGYDQTALYRFTLNPTETVTDTTVELLPDYVVQNIKTAYVTIGGYRNYTATDGALLSFSRSRYLTENPFISLFSTKATQTYPFESRIGKTFGQLMHRSATGAWMAYTDRGLVTNE